MNRDQRERLGASSLNPGVEIEGCSFSAVLEPASSQALAEAMCRLTSEDLRVLVRGGGTKLGFGNPPKGGDLLLSTRGLSGIRCLESGDGVVEAGGGTPLREIRAAVLERGWELPLDAGGSEATLGGVVATAAYGPRCLGFGPVRRNVLGLELVHASGKITHCGGRVVKNVTGYDLSKLYTGSLGTLGVIAGGWMRLLPRPRQIALRTAEFSESAEALSAALRASRRSSARACVLVTPEIARDIGLEHSLAASWVLAVEFAGEPSECAHDAAWVESDLAGARPTEHEGVSALATFDRLRDRFISPLDVEIARIRIATLPTRLERSVHGLMKTGARIHVDPGLGLVHAESRDHESLLAAAREAARACHGVLLIEAMPMQAGSALDVFGEVGPDLAVMRQLKDQFDPDCRINPGRFMGRI